MSWESTQLYYQLINRMVADALGGHHSADLLLASIDFAPVAEWQHAGEWDRIADHLNARALELAAAGAEALVICTNTIHLVADRIGAGTGLPVIHVVDCVGTSIIDAGYRRVGLLGTRFTMESPTLYPERLADMGVSVVTPDEPGRADVHQVIYEELCHGRIRTESRIRYLETVSGLADRGAEAVILGCTEIGLLLDESVETPIPFLDSTRIHARAAVDFALDEQS